MANTFHAKDAACVRCGFFDNHAAQTGAAKTGIGSDVGLCRYNPPVSQPSSEAHGLWPVVSDTDWCGHYELQGSATAAATREGVRAAS